MLPSITLQRGLETAPGWSIRVVPNKYPVVGNSGVELQAVDVSARSIPAAGYHEVVIETWRHNGRLERMSQDQAGNVLSVIWSRARDLLTKPGVALVLPFRNYGPRAGTSLVHPHSQLVALNVVPTQFRRQQRSAHYYYDETARCVYCQMMRSEEDEVLRVLLANRGFVAFVPFAAGSPFEVWLMPRRHRADFTQIGNEELSNLADSLLDILRRIDSKLGAPDFNLVLITAPRANLEAPYLHWYVRIIPRLTTPAGFEIASGVNVNPSLPEADARHLNEARSGAEQSAETGM